MRRFCSRFQDSQVSQSDNIFWRQFGAILLALIVFGVVVAFIARAIGGSAHRAAINSPSAVAERIAPEGRVRVGDPQQTVAAAQAPEPEPEPESQPAMAAAAGPASGTTGDGEQIYGGVCKACHAAGVAGAPKLDDAEAWAPRLELGTDALIASVINGKGAMPPKGGNPSLTEDQIRAAVEYMVNAVEGGGTAAAPATPPPGPNAADAAAAAGEAAQQAVSEAAGTVSQAVEKGARTAVKAAEEGAQAAGKAVEEGVQAAEKAAQEGAQAAGAAVSQAKQAAEQAGEAATGAANAAGAALAAAAPAAGGEAAAAGKPGDEVYNMGCVACHATGAANAPKLDDKAAWETRAAGGIDALVGTVLSGKGAMPPKGGVPTLTEADIENAVRYMLEQAGVSAGG